ncbi:uncharacterized protein DUF2877 [Orbus hercynius]|uniref:Uncharacterized protein DUF2877 n=1 Tax=Orbus hercynius TaxID=593135 RepID=A0A495RJX9_9GAMM|nr:DUF2877 domain-containing protein [Orbus hercynius]RKS87466.1 uncharacterized protein DUF2877 [Orbus hercynius]
MTIVKPLAISDSVPALIGTLHCLSIHDRVINLVNDKQQLVTLHCHHNDISPMGYVLKQRDFAHVKEQLAANASLPMRQKANGIEINQRLISNDTRKLNLMIHKKFISSFTFIDQLMHQFEHQTGLFGPLKSIRQNTLPPELNKLIEQILLLLDDEPYDLSFLIGLGPGLTPTGDDIITGILLIIQADPFCSRLLNPVPHTLNLPLLDPQTTRVSANFLAYAAQGIFSANLLNVIHLIGNKRTINLTSVKRLLNYGHTSGADILLGIWLGSLILEKYKYR